MTPKRVKTVRKTVIIYTNHEDTVPIFHRALDWEYATKTPGSRRVLRVERAAPGAGVKTDTVTYLIDMELTCRGANRNDFTKFVRSYLPEVDFHFITE